MPNYSVPVVYVLNDWFILEILGISYMMFNKL